jgi:hypothetical protein
VGKIQTDSLREISGIAASRRNPGVLYVHNDSGDGARIYALNEKAELLAVCSLKGAIERDWEDIAVGPGPDPNRPYLYIGDIGDNGARRPEVVVYRVPEPQVDPGRPFGQMSVGPAEAIRLVYPEGPRDAETLLVDPLTRDLYIISKREWVPKVYRAAYPQSTTQRTELQQVAVLPFGAFPTGGDVSPDGRRVIVRGMFNATLWDRPLDGDEAPGARDEGTPARGARPQGRETREEFPSPPVPRAPSLPADPAPLWHAFSAKPVVLPLADEPQGEAICFDHQGRGYFTISEGRRPALHYFGPTEPNVLKPEGM